jgi:hypothetical protein
MLDVVSRKVFFFLYLKSWKQSRCIWLLHGLFSLITNSAKYNVGIKSSSSRLLSTLIKNIVWVSVFIKRLFILSHNCKGASIHQIPLSTIYLHHIPHAWEWLTIVYVNYSKKNNLMHTKQAPSYSWWVNEAWKSPLQSFQLF